MQEHALLLAPQSQMKYLVLTLMDVLAPLTPSVYPKIAIVMELANLTAMMDLTTLHPLASALIMMNALLDYVHLIVAVSNVQLLLLLLTQLVANANRTLTAQLTLAILQLPKQLDLVFLNAMLMEPLLALMLSAALAQLMMIV